MPATTISLSPRDECRSFLRNFEGYYVYILHRPDGRPFYIGKGRGNRVFHHKNEARHPNGPISNSHKLNAMRSILTRGALLSYSIHYVGAEEGAAYLLEAQLIDQHGRLHEGGCLTNRAPGGGSVRGPSPYSTAKHAATLAGEPDNNTERAILNRFVRAIAPMKSVPLKPASQFIAKPTQRFPRSKRTTTLRPAVALVASASMHGIALDKAARIPRELVVEGVSALIENGVACDILTGEMASIEALGKPSEEAFILSEEQARTVVGLVGRRRCSDLGLLNSAAF